VNAALAWIAGTALFVWLCVDYSATPSDPQEAVGYVFIAFYCAAFGGFLFGSATFFSMFRESRRQPLRAAMLGLIAVVFAGIALMMVMRHPS
jgi:H+/Cl- antiporter ClcA